MVKVAIVGVGNISIEHINAYLKNPAVELVAFCDINQSRLEERGKQFGIDRLYLSIDDLLADGKDIDAVSICTWNTSHAENTIKALDAGKHVLCEKPMAHSVSEALRMKEAAERNQKTLMIGFVRRFGNDTKVIEKFIDDDSFGSFYYAKAELLRRHGNPGGWFSDKSRSAGGPLIDLGVHVIDLVRYLMGQPKVVSVYGATFNKIFNSRDQLIDRPAYVSESRVEGVTVDVEDLAVAMIRFENGVVLNVEASFALDIKEDRMNIEMFGTEGGFSMSPQIEMYSNAHGHLTNTTFDTDTALNFSGLFENEINHFIDVITKDVQCISPAEDGVEMMRILEAIYKSAELQEEVKLGEKNVKQN